MTALLARPSGTLGGDGLLRPIWARATATSVTLAAAGAEIRSIHHRVRRLVRVTSSRTARTARLRRRGPSRGDAGAGRGRRSAGLGTGRLVCHPGAVRSDGRATFEAAVVGRILALGGAIESPDLVVQVGAAVVSGFRAIAVPATIGEFTSAGSRRTRCARPRVGWPPSSRRAGWSWPTGRCTADRAAVVRSRQADGTLPESTSRQRSPRITRPVSAARCSRSAGRSSTGSPGTSG